MEKSPILIVEDDEQMPELACECLTGKGFTVLVASDGAEAIALVERRPAPIDLVISDVVMPGMSGPKPVEKLKELRPQIKAIFVSGYTENTIVHHGVLDPGIEFVRKPYMPADLARKVRSVLAQWGPSAK